MPDIGQMMLLSLVFMRMSGFILLNPVLGRKNIPAYVKGGMVMVFTLLIYSFYSAEVPEPVNSIEYAVLLVKEFAVGVAVGFVMELFVMVITYAGYIIDFQMGLSMSTIYDPQSNAQLAITGSIWNAYYFLLFFAVDGHLALIKILIESSKIIPYGQVVVSPAVAWNIMEVFTQCIILAVKFSFPLVAIEFLSEVAVGILMKMIPQINIFVVNIQVKLIVGFLMLLFLFVPMSDKLGDIVNLMLQAVQNIIILFS